MFIWLLLSVSVNLSAADSVAAALTEAGAVLAGADAPGELVLGLAAAGTEAEVAGLTGTLGLAAMPLA